MSTIQSFYPRGIVDFSPKPKTKLSADLQDCGCVPQMPHPKPLVPHHPDQFCLDQNSSESSRIHHHQNHHHHNSRVNRHHHHRHHHDHHLPPAHTSPKPAPPAEEKTSFFKKIGNLFGAIFSLCASCVAIVGNQNEKMKKVLVGAWDHFSSGEFWKGIKHIFVGAYQTIIRDPLDNLTYALLRSISAVQNLLGLEANGRRLTTEEISLLKEIYGPTIDYSKVRIKEGKCGLLGCSDRPWTLGNTIYFPTDNNGQINKAILVHEMAHVWQFQTKGPGYMLDSLGAQYLGDGYDFEKAVRQGEKFEDFNVEQQAALIEAAFRAGYLTGQKDYCRSQDGLDYTAWVEQFLANTTNDSSRHHHRHHRAA